MRQTIKNVLFPPKDFYSIVLKIAVPIMIQNGITNFVGMLDNIMVGQIGTDAMSGVSIVNQLMFVFYLCIFGSLAGIGIFTAQFWGKCDMQGMRYSLRAKMLVAFGITAAGILVLFIGGNFLINTFLHEGGNTGDVAVTLSEAKKYLNVMYLSMLPMAIANVYSSTLRETGQTVLPMTAGIVAVIVNLAGNYILIYGKLGAPALGVRGAALATAFSRIVEMLIVGTATHCDKHKNPYIKGCYGSFKIPATLVKKFTIKGAPLLVNEALWSVGMTFLLQCYSIRGLTAVAALNISNTLSNVFNIVFLTMGSSAGIILGQRLGSGKLSDAKTWAFRMAVFSEEISVIAALLLLAVSPFFPSIYKTTDEAKRLAEHLLMISAAAMPLYSFSNVAYFTLRSGGKTMITFLFDSVFVWAVSVPVAFILSRFTGLSVLAMYAAVQSLEFIKNISGFIMVKKGKWINDLTVY